MTDFKAGDRVLTRGFNTLAETDGVIAKAEPGVCEIRLATHQLVIRSTSEVRLVPIALTLEDQVKALQVGDKVRVLFRIPGDSRVMEVVDWVTLRGGVMSEFSNRLKDIEARYLAWRHTDPACMTTPAFADTPWLLSELREAHDRLEVMLVALRRGTLPVVEEHTRQAVEKALTEDREERFAAMLDAYNAGWQDGYNECQDQA